MAEPIWVWGGFKTIESVQRRFTAIFKYCKHLTYVERLKLLHIDRLENADLTLTLPVHTKLSSDWLT